MAREKQKPVVHDCPQCHMRPGSDTALAKGCKCAVLDNAHGHSPEFWTWVNLDCPVHGEEANPDLVKD